MQRFVVAFVPGFQDDKQRAHIRRKDLADQALPGQAEVILHARQLFHDGFSLRVHLIGARQGSARWQGDVHNKIPFVFVGEETRRYNRQQARRAKDHQPQGQTSQDQASDQEPHHAEIPSRGAIKGPVEAAEELAERPARLRHRA